MALHAGSGGGGSGSGFLHGNSNPSTGSGVPASIPNLYLKNDDGSVWTKVGELDTDWLQLNNGVVGDVLVMAEQAADPSAVSDHGKLYTKDEDGVTQLFYEASDETVFQITSNELSSSTDTAAWHRIGDLFGVERFIGTLDDYDFVVKRFGVEKVRVQAGLMILTGAADAAMGIDIRSNGPDGDPAYIYLTNKQGAIIRFDFPSLGGGTAYYTKESYFTMSSPSGFGLRCNVNGTNNSGWDLDPNGYMTINAVRQSFYAATPVAQQTITGSRGASAALADLLTKLALTGLIVDGSSA